MPDSEPDADPPRQIRMPLWRKLVIAIASALPPLGFLASIPFANRPGPFVLGLPFLQFWCTFCLLATGVCLTVVFHLDPRNHVPDDADERAC